MRPPSTPSATVRVIMRDGEPWFVLSDVCKILDFVNPSRIADSLDEDEKGLHSVNTLDCRQELNVASESGLYSLVLTNRKPEANTFKR